MILNYKSIFEIKVTDISKDSFKLEKFRGNVLLIVNISTTCGLAAQCLNELSNLLVPYKSRGLKILLFPCFNLLLKKPKKELQNYISQFSDDFILMNEVHVTGPKIHPLFQFLNSKNEFFLCGEIRHNFTYFLINREGDLIKKYLPTEKLLLDSDPDIVKCIGNVPEKVKEFPIQKTCRFSDFESDFED